MTVPTNPKLWQLLKAKARKSDEGSPPGRWSAQKAALARRQYERAGGKFKKIKATPRPALLRAASKKVKAAGNGKTY